MNYTLIKGIYYVVGQSPDGDSIKFKAANPAFWQLINSEFNDVFAQNLAAEGGMTHSKHTTPHRSRLCQQT